MRRSLRHAGDLVQRDLQRQRRLDDAVHALRLQVVDQLPELGAHEVEPRDVVLGILPRRERMDVREEGTRVFLYAEDRIRRRKIVIAELAAGECVGEVPLVGVVIQLAGGVERSAVVAVQRIEDDLIHVVRVEGIVVRQIVETDGLERILVGQRLLDDGLGRAADQRPERRLVERVERKALQLVGEQVGRRRPGRRARRRCAGTARTVAAATAGSKEQQYDKQSLHGLLAPRRKSVCPVLVRIAGR